jgi:proteic killer suppression protein
MIQSWKSDVAKAIFEGRDPGKGFPSALARAARRRLAAINAAVNLGDLRSPPGNRLHELRGERAGEWSISVNDQFRITFRWGEAGPENVWIGDYH